MFQAYPRTLDSKDTKLTKPLHLKVVGQKNKTAVSPAPVASPAPGKRTGWNVAKKSHTSAGEQLLVKMLFARANELGHQLQEMAAQLGVTYGYIAQLRNGMRKCEHISNQFATSCSGYLGTPRMTVLLAAKHILPEDMFADPHAAAKSVPAAMDFVSRDPRFGPLMPVALRHKDVPYEVQFFIVSLYEEATGTKLIPGRVDATTMLLKIEQFEQHRATLAKAGDAGKGPQTV